MVKIWAGAGSLPHSLTSQWHKAQCCHRLLEAEWDNRTTDSNTVSCKHSFGPRSLGWSSTLFFFFTPIVYSTFPSFPPLFFLFCFAFSPLFFSSLPFLPFVLFFRSAPVPLPCDVFRFAPPNSTPILLCHLLPSCPLFSSPFSCLSSHPPDFSVASSQANNQLINQLIPRIIEAALRGAL